ncbi:MAG: hypothetical protein IJ532_01910 [Alphaproteobacteria bacterium]|nr:hypothetical protein [Alphaproteobacteria bacterium]
MKKLTIILFIFGVCIGFHGLVGMFCQNHYFDYLISAFLVAIVLGLIYQWTERTIPLPTQCIRTPCPIVYRNSERDFLYCLPYLDLLRTNDVWGVEVADIKVSKKNNIANWKKAKSYLKEGEHRNIGVRLPDVVEMLIIVAKIKKFEKTIRILEENKVNAERFSYGKYWYVDMNLLGKITPKIIYPHAGKFFKTLCSRKKPTDLKEVFYVRLVAQE